MAWFEATHDETRSFALPPDVVRAHFADLKTIVAQSADLQTAEIDGDTVHFVTKEEEHAGVMKFQGRFSCRYRVEDGRLVWDTAPGSNMIQQGEARFVAKGGGTELHYTETVKLDLDLPAMMVPMLRPVIAAMVSQGIQGYVKRMSASLLAG